MWWATPATLLVFLVHFVAVATGGAYAFTNWNGVSPEADWVGLANFEQFFSTAATRNALFNTIVLAVGSVVLSNAIGLGLALGLNRTIKSRNVLRALFFTPVILSPLAVSYVWRYIFDATGPLNSVLSAVGLDALVTPWLADPFWARWTILVVMVWQYSGMAMALYLAGLQSIPVEVEEAAAIDGANVFQRFRNVIVPLLAPAFTVSLTLITIWSLRAFDQVFAMTGGGPASASETLATQIYKQTWVSGKFGYGATVALVLTVIVATVSIVQLLILRRREQEV